MKTRTTANALGHASREFAGLSNREFAAMGHPKPGNGCDAWATPFQWETDERVRMETASKNLLAALWKHHQRALLVAAALGRSVVKPPIYA